MSKGLALTTTVERMPELERLFREGTNGWLGGDCAFSTPLNDGRILWLFGDSFVSSDPEARSRAGSHIVANTIAIQRGHEVRFWWKEGGGRGPTAFFSSPELPGRSWPLSAVRIGEALAVLAVRVVTVDPNQVTGFRLVGHEVYWVPNPDEEPHRWEITLRQLPWSEKTGTFGSWLLADQGYLYIYGFRRHFRSWFKEVWTLVARAPLEDAHRLVEPERWEYLDGEHGRWYKNPAAARPVLHKGATEFSVSYLPELGKFVLLAASWRRGNPIQVRVAETPYGPFSEACTVYVCPEALANRRYFCYAAKAHPELASSPAELVVSYAVNSRKLEDCYHDEGIYYPRFLRVSVLPQRREGNG
ncbi:MAG: DUF4185 domain-containing protein [Calditrichaeota bacterium]|nr:DUF4185 domain-containing protein [Calditrichota bacterium]